MVREALTFERLKAMAPEEAAALFVARRAEGLTESEAELFDQWLAGDRANARQFERAQSGWDWVADGDGHEILTAMREHALAPRPSRSWSDFMPQAVAAAVLCLLTAVSVLLLAPQWRSGPSGGEATGAPILYASAGELREFKLPDGSTMILDTHSEAVARYSAGTRSLELKRGRAFFDVVTDRVRPFSVSAGQRRVAALGTRFDVRIEPDALTVTLMEGRVTVGPLDPQVKPVELKPGQQFVERGSRAVIRNLDPEGPEAAGWTRGLLHFSDVTLAEAAAEVSRYSSIPLRVTNPKVSSLRISGEFQAGDAARFADTVAELHPVRVVRHSSEIELVPAS